jgi:hypothetical protein
VVDVEKGAASSGLFGASTVTGSVLSVDGVFVGTLQTEAQESIIDQLVRRFLR